MKGSKGKKNRFWNGELLKLEGCGSLSKRLLEHVAAQGNFEPLDVYKRLLGDLLTIGHSSNAVSNLKNKLAKRYYGKPGQDPKFWNIDNVNQLAMLRLETGVHFVIYQAHKKFGVQRVFDNRVMVSLSQDVYVQPDPIVFVLEAGKGKSFDLYVLRRKEKLGIRKEILGNLEDKFAVGSRVSSTPCLLKALAEVARVDLPEALPAPETWTLLDVCEKAQLVWKLLKREILIVEHVGFKPWTSRQRNLFRPKRNRFRIIVEIFDRDTGAERKINTMMGVSVSYHGLLSVLDTQNMQKLLDNRHGDAAPNPGKVGDNFPYNMEDEGGGEAGDLEDSGGDPQSYKGLSPCECKLCEECKKYSKNMEPRGGQALYKVEWDLRTFMSCFALDTEENLSALETCLKLSVSGMDLETSTVQIDSSLPPGLDTRNFSAPHERLTSNPRPGTEENELAQRILLIGHIDNMEDPSQDLSGSVRLFETPRSSSGVQDVVEEYIRYVLIRQSQMEAKKRLLLAPLLLFIKEHKDAFFSYFESRGILDEKKSVGAWANCLLGKFEKKVHKMAKKYYVYAFNASGFDLPLLCGHIATSPWMSRHWKVQRNGSEVTQMSLPVRCIYFRDLKKMLAQGFSLSSLARTVGLKEEKMRFPYGILKEQGEALDESELPPYGPRWFDVLTQRTPDRSYVEEARRNFEELGCESVRDYLQEYLKMDLALLLRCALMLLDKFDALTGISPVDCDKSTLSSYSMFCSQMHLVWEKKPGAFCNNNPAIYNVIRNSLRGGLTLVSRTSVNAGESESLNEPHLVSGDEGERAKTLHYLDVSGLYSAAGTGPLPFGPCTFFWKSKEAGEAESTLTHLADASADCSEELKRWAKDKTAGYKHDMSKKLRRMPAQFEAHCNKLSRLEFVWVQSHMLDLAPGALLCCSGLHAGLGQVTFGSDWRQKADLTVVKSPGLIEVLNFHGSYYHYDGHENSCRLSDPLSPFYSPKGFSDQDDAFKVGLAKALSAPGKISFTYKVVTECEAFHGSHPVAAPDLAERHGEAYLAPPPFLEIDPDSLVQKLLEGSLKGFITVRGGSTETKDKVGSLFSFCQQLVHPKEEEFSEFSMRQIEELCGYDEDSVKKRIKDVKSRPLNMVKSYFEEEDCNTFWSEQFLWLVRRRKLTGYEVVHFVHYNARAWFKPFLEKNLQARWEIKGQPDRTLDSQILKLLNNGFYGYNSIQATNFSKSTVTSEKTLVQHRERYRTAQQLLLLGSKAKNPKSLKRKIETPSGDFEERAFKEIEDYEERLEKLGIAPPPPLSSAPPPPKKKKKKKKEKKKKKGKKKKKKKRNSRGACGEGRKKKSDAPAARLQEKKEELSESLIFLVTRKNDKGKLLNLQQISGCILGLSKVIFYDHIVKILELLDPRKAEICYLDTDSIILALSEDSLEQCVESGKEELYQSSCQELFVDECSPVHQTGKLKLEMKASAGLFRAVKTYYLEPLSEEPDSVPETMVRAKGVAMQNQKAMTKDMFRVDSAPVYANRYKMAPDANLNVTILHESKKLATSLNLKRRQFGETGVCSLPL